jgi:hypothetical protein
LGRSEGEGKILIVFQAFFRPVGYRFSSSDSQATISCE